MNLLLRYVQDNKETALSPYVFVLGIFIAPIMSSIAYQGAVYRLSQIGLRLRALLGHAVYAKVLRVKAGGGGTKGDNNEDGEESQGSGGSDALGRVNSERASTLSLCLPLADTCLLEQTWLGPILTSSPLHL